MISLQNPGADIFVPDGLPVAEAARRITHLAIGAHQDDLEFMAYHGIVTCYDRPGWSFGGVTCTDGAGSARQGLYAEKTDEEMRSIRGEEQRAAARLGRYGLMVQLGHSTKTLKTAASNPLTPDLMALFSAVSPRVVYTHNPADKHETHLHVFAAVIEALRSLPAEKRPMRVYGCEVWRGLDWMEDSEKVVHDVSPRPELAAALNQLFDSQISGGKNYGLATEGRRRANATYLAAHHVDHVTHASYAMDLTPLVRDAALDPVDYTQGFIERFRSDVSMKLRRALR